MDFLKTSFQISLKRILKPSILFLATFLFIALFIADFVQEELKMKVSIGVLYDRGSEISSEIIRNISDFSSIDLVEYDDLQKLVADVSLAKLECAYVFEDNIENGIKNGNINNAVKLYKSKQTISDGLINELIFAALLKTASPYIASNYLYNQKNSDFDLLLNDNKSKIKSYYEQDIFMNNNFEYVGIATDSADNTNRIAVGIIAMFLFIYFFYAAIEGISKRNSSVYTKLLKHQKISYIFSDLAANALVLLSIMIIPCMVLGLSIFVLALYIISLAVMSSVIIYLFRNSSIIYSFFPVISICVAVLGGAFIDLNDFSPMVGKLQYFFPTYYFVVYML